MFHNLVDNCRVNPNGKLITLCPFKKKNKSAVQFDGEPRQEATCVAQEDNIPPFIFNINKGARCSYTEEDKVGVMLEKGR